MGTLNYWSDDHINVKGLTVATGNINITPTITTNPTDILAVDTTTGIKKIPISDFGEPTTVPNTVVRRDISGNVTANRFTPESLVIDTTNTTSIVLTLTSAENIIIHGPNASVLTLPDTVNIGTKFNIINISIGDVTIKDSSGATLSTLSPSSIIECTLADVGIWVNNAPSGSSVSFPIGISQGGTGQITANAALNALLPTQTAGTVLATDGTNSSWASITIDNTKGIGGTVTGGTTLQLNPTSTGILKGSSGALVAATANTDYIGPSTFTTLAANDLVSYNGTQWVNVTPATLKSTLALNNVTNDAQLKRSGGDYSTFTNKINPVPGDTILIEDSVNAYAKNSATLSSLPISVPVQAGLNTKMSTVTGAVNGHLASFNSSGQVIDSGYAINSNNSNSVWPSSTIVSFNENLKSGALIGSVDYVTTANEPLVGGSYPVLSLVLVGKQLVSSQNGIYYASTGNWIRAVWDGSSFIVDTSITTCNQLGYNFQIVKNGANYWQIVISDDTALIGTTSIDVIQIHNPFSFEIDYSAIHVADIGVDTGTGTIESPVRTLEKAQQLSNKDIFVTGTISVASTVTKNNISFTGPVIIGANVTITSNTNTFTKINFANVIIDAGDYGGHVFKNCSIGTLTIQSTSGDITLQSTIVTTAIVLPSTAVPRKIILIDVNNVSFSAVPLDWTVDIFSGADISFTTVNGTINDRRNIVVTFTSTSPLSDGYYIFTASPTVGNIGDIVMKRGSNTSVIHSYGTVPSVIRQDGVTCVPTGSGHWAPAGTSTVTYPISIANGGTGQTTAIAAINALLPIQTAGKVLTTDGTNSNWASITIDNTKGIGGTVTGGTTLQLNPTSTGILKGSSGALVAATANTDYIGPSTFTTLAANDLVSYNGTQWVNVTPATLKSTLALNNVTNDAQLKRSGGDINLFTTKSVPADADVLLIEDSAGAFTKAKITVGSIKTTYPISIANGGTGQITANAALNALLPTQTAGTVLATDGTNSSWASITIDNTKGIGGTVTGGTTLQLNPTSTGILKGSSGALVAATANTDYIGPSTFTTLAANDLVSYSGTQWVNVTPATLKSTLALNNVTNDAQLKRSAGDINTFTTKTTPVSADVLLIEDSAASFAKAKITLGSMPVTLTDGNILVGNASNIGQSTTLSGDVTINNTGVATISTGVVTNAKLDNMAANSIKGNNTGSAAVPIDLTPAQVTSLIATSVPTASKIPIWDTNVNLNTNNVNYSTTSTATSGGTLTLTSTSSLFQYLTGTSNHTVKLPSSTSLMFVVRNDSTGVITIQDAASTLVYTLPSGASAICTPTTTGWKVIGSNNVIASPATNGDVATLTSTGQLTDSGWSLSDTLTSLTNIWSASNTYTNIKNVVSGKNVNVNLVTVVNDTLSGLTVRNSYTPVVGEYVLVANQTSVVDNGVYKVASGAWSRAYWTGSAFAAVTTQTQLSQLGYNDLSFSIVQSGSAGQQYMVIFPVPTANIGTGVVDVVQVYNESFTSANVYIDPLGGSDTYGNGSLSRPFKTIPSIANNIIYFIASQAVTTTTITTNNLVINGPITFSNLTLNCNNLTFNNVRFTQLTILTSDLGGHIFNGCTFDNNVTVNGSATNSITMNNCVMSAQLILASSAYQRSLVLTNISTQFSITGSSNWTINIGNDCFGAVVDSANTASIVDKRSYRDNIVSFIPDAATLTTLSSNTSATDGYYITTYASPSIGAIGDLLYKRNGFTGISLAIKYAAAPPIIYSSGSVFTKSGSGVWAILAVAPTTNALGVISTLTSGTSYTAPYSGMYRFILVGGGGGGGGSALTKNGGGGGGSGAVTCIVTYVAASTVLTYSIGSGGTGGLATGTAGGVGGNTTITIASVVYTATGGNGGQPGTTPGTGASGGVAVTATGGTKNINGNAGSNSGTSTTSYTSGAGGSTPLLFGYGTIGVGGVAVNNNSITITANGNAASGNGAGGSGGAQSPSGGATGGAGSGGIILVEF